MNWQLIALVGILALLCACADGQLPGGNSGNDNVADFAVTIATELPVAGTFRVNNQAVDCLAHSTECEIEVDEPREYRLDVECPFHGFVDKHVDVTEDDNGQTIEVAEWVWGAMPAGTYTEETGSSLRLITFEPFIGI